jgi:hypothetical protein
MQMKGVKFPQELIAMGSDKMPMPFPATAHVQAVTKDTKAIKFDLPGEDEFRDNHGEFDEFDDEDFEDDGLDNDLYDDPKMMMSPWTCRRPLPVARRVVAGTRSRFGSRGTPTMAAATRMVRRSRTKVAGRGGAKIGGGPQQQPQ